MWKKDEEGIESAIRSEADKSQRSFDFSQQWAECEEDYIKATKIVAYLTSLEDAISTDQKKTLAVAEEFVKNYEESIMKVRNSIADLLNK